MSGVPRVIGYFWDIENCQIPRNGKAFDIAQKVRTLNRNGARQTHYACYGEIEQLTRATRQDLNRANVTVIDTCDSKKGAADRAIMQALDLFSRHPDHQHPVQVTIVLISGDIDFVSKLSDLRHRFGYEVILVHNGPARKELKDTASDCVPWPLLCALDIAAVRSQVSMHLLALIHIYITIMITKCPNEYGNISRQFCTH